MSNIIIMALASFFFLPEIRVADYVKSKGDKNGKRLLPKRLQTMQGYFCMMLFSLTFLHGNAIVPSLMPGCRCCGRLRYLSVCCAAEA